MSKSAQASSERTKGSQIIRWVGGLLLCLFLITFLAGLLFDKPLGNDLERRMNAALQGYQVEIAKIDFNPFDLSLTFFDLTVSQDAHPQPPVILVPKLFISVHWAKLLTGNLVAEWHVFKPTLHVNLQQLRAEDEDETAVEERGWQEALKSLYPLEINLLEINQATLTYIDQDPDNPLQLDNANLIIRNIRNIDSPNVTYPSQFLLDTDIFGQGHGVVEGVADFLAEPYPGVKADFKLQNILLKKLQPLTARGNVHISEGTLEGAGQIEFSPKIRHARLANLVVDGLLLDYVHSASTAEQEKARARQAKKILKKTDQLWTYVVDDFQVRNGNFGFVNRARDPSFRLTLDAFDLKIENLSNRFHNGEANLVLQGQFMHTGDTFAMGHFRPESKGPDFDFLLAIEETHLTEMNNFLRAYSGVDVVAGTFSLYSEIVIKEQKIDGYVKPIFENLDVYGSEQDENDSLISKLKEGIVGALSKILENKQDKVATQFDLSGTVENPEADTLEIILQLIRNAFFDAILPGFKNSDLIANPS